MEHGLQVLKYLPCDFHMVTQMQADSTFWFWCLSLKWLCHFNTQFLCSFYAHNQNKLHASAKLQ